MPHLEESIMRNLEREAEKIQHWVRRQVKDWQRIPGLALLAFNHESPSTYWRIAFESQIWQASPFRDKVYVDCATGRLHGDIQSVISAFLAGKLDAEKIVRDLLEAARRPKSAQDMRLRETHAAKVRLWENDLALQPDPGSPRIHLS